MLEAVFAKKVLVVGVGGGNDILSAIYVAKILKDRNISVDVAGVCSPGAVHHFNGSIEQPINVVTSDCSREIPSKNPIKISFIDPSVKQFCDQKFPCNIYDFSLRYGTARLIEDLDKLVKANNYDMILAVDVGGDILARAEDTSILSPMMDFSMLYVISQLSVPSMLVEFGLQTDGELRNCHDILEDLYQNRTLLVEEDIQITHSAIQLLRDLYQQVSPVRKGNTVRLFLENLLSPNDITTQFHFQAQLLGQKWKAERPLLLESKYFRQLYLFDLKKLAALRKQTCFSYENPLDQFIRLKTLMGSKTEMDLLYYQENFQGKPSQGKTKSIWLGIVPPQFKWAEEEIVHLGLDNLHTHASGAIIRTRNRHLVPPNWKTEMLQDFLLVKPLTLFA